MISLEVFWELDPRQAELLCALQRLADGDGRVTASKPALAEAMGWRKGSGVRQAVIALERHGLIRVHRNGPDYQRRPCTYEVLPLGHAVAENIAGMEAA